MQVSVEPAASVEKLSRAADRQIMHSLLTQLHPGNFEV